jgi:hypothetical protein
MINMEHNLKTTMHLNCDLIPLLDKNQTGNFKIVWYH